MIDDALVAFVKTAGAFSKLIFTKEPKKREIQQDTPCISGTLTKKIFWKLYIQTINKRQVLKVKTGYVLPEVWKLSISACIICNLRRRPKS